MDFVTVRCLQNSATGQRILEWDGLPDGEPEYYAVEEDYSAGQRVDPPADFDTWEPCTSPAEDRHELRSVLIGASRLPVTSTATITKAFDAFDSIVIGPSKEMVVRTSVVGIDGSSGILAQARPTAIWRDDRTVARAIIQIDAADLQNGHADESVILHELLHCAGFANMPGLPFHDFVERDEFGRLVFAGPAATRAWQDIGGTGHPPLYEPDGGSHWDEDTLGVELQTPFSDGTSNVLTALTLGALIDIGYDVDRQAAQKFNMRDALGAEICSSCSISKSA